MRPGFITINRRQSRLQGDGNTKNRRLRPSSSSNSSSASKVMATVFWDMRGVLLVEFQEHGRTANASSYCSLLGRLKTAIRTKRKGLLTQGVILIHDNARPHTARLTLKTVEQLWLEVLPHPPYSPDLVPVTIIFLG